MDQLKVVLQAIKKHHFWILCGVIVVVVLAVWWSATSGLAGIIKERRDALDAKMTNVRSVAAQSLHENQDVVDGIDANQKLTTKSVREAWELLHEKQKEYMEWPVLLGPDFAQYMKFLPPSAPIPDQFRDRYMYFIQDYFPTLYEIVDIRLHVQLDERGNPVLDEDGNKQKVDPFEGSRGRQTFAGEGAGMPMAMPMGDAYDSGGYGDGRTSGSGDLIGVVDWEMADLKRIRDSLFWPNRPETIQVRLAQEDLWVYEALLRSIAATNGEVKSYHKAAVKQIRALEIGQRAAPAFAQSRGISLRTGGSMTMGSYGDEMMGGDEYAAQMADTMVEPDEAGAPMSLGAGPSPYSAGMPGTAASPEEQLKTRLLENRYVHYVDNNLEPLPASEATAGESKFKMMPVRMLLLVDQRKITQLLVQCANASMPVVVTKVALNPGRGTIDFTRFSSGGRTAYEEGGSDLMYGGAMSPGAPMGTGAPMMPRPGMMPGDSTYDMYEDEGSSMGMGPGMGTSQRQGQQTTYDIPIEIQGVIYIFNPPDSEKLGVGTAGEGAAAPAAAGATAAPAPAAGGTTGP